MRPFEPTIGIGPRIRKSPYFEATRRAGCRAYTVYNHTYLPLHVTGMEADYRHLLSAAALWDVGGQRQVEIRGRDAARLVAYLCPRDLTRWEIGQCKYAVLTDNAGGIVNDPVMLKLADDRFWLSLSDSDALLWARGIAFAGGFDVTVEEPDVWPLQVQGPTSVAVVGNAFGATGADLRYFRFMEAEIDGIPVVVSRTGWSGERGYEVFVDGYDKGEKVWDALMAAGRPHGLQAGAPNLIRRVEAGLLSYGADMGLTENPFEMGLERLADLDREADFVGKEALLGIRARGPARRLVGLDLDGPALPPNESHWAVHGPDGPAGVVTSVVHSPRLGRNIALARVLTASATAGTALDVETPAGRRAATVVAIPFHDSAKTLPRA